MNFKDKVVIVTGGTRGIGLEVAKSFYEKEANVIIFGSKKESVDKTVEELSKDNILVEGYYPNLNNYQEVVETIDKIYNKYKKIDVLINNAGISTVKLLNKSKLEEVKALFNVNYFSMLNMIQKISKKMVRQKSGVIINMGSIAGIEPQPGKIAYGSSKAAVLFMTQCLAKELGPLGIRVNAIAPGPIETEMIQQYNTEQLKQLSVESSLRRLGKTEEIAQVALFLASERASYINGAIIKVDGGR